MADFHRRLARVVWFALLQHRASPQNLGIDMTLHATSNSRSDERMDAPLPAERAVSSRPPIPYDDRATQLQSIRGRYHPRSNERNAVNCGHVDASLTGTIDVAQIGNHQGTIRRDTTEIKFCAIAHVPIRVSPRFCHR
jgi:hypothetical protein